MTLISGCFFAILFALTQEPVNSWSVIPITLCPSFSAYVIPSSNFIMQSRKRILDAKNNQCVHECYPDNPDYTLASPPFYNIESK